MKRKKQHFKVIVVDSETLMKGFFSHINESGTDPVENADNFFERSDEELLLQNSFAPGRIKMDNLMDGEAFSISDAASGRTTYEFDSGFVLIGSTVKEPKPGKVGQRQAEHDAANQENEAHAKFDGMQGMVTAQRY